LRRDDRIIRSVEFHFSAPGSPGARPTVKLYGSR
jgi:hypothetical protein